LKSHSKRKSPLGEKYAITEDDTTLSASDGIGKATTSREAFLELGRFADILILNQFFN